MKFEEPAIKIFIPHRFPGENEIVAAAKSHYGQYSAMKKRETGLVEAFVRDAVNRSGKPHRYQCVSLRITWIEPDGVKPQHERDPDNVAAAKKFLLDGLVKSGVIPNDRRANIWGWTESFGTHKEPGVLLEIWDRTGSP